MVVMSADLMNEIFFSSSGLATDFAARSRLGIYVHVPFCPHICPYCDFVKTSHFSRQDISSYFSALELQFDALIEYVPIDVTTITLYLGGGTPSLFPAHHYEPLVEKIRRRFEIEEFTVESNPFSNTQRSFVDWKKLGVNRITLGAQSLNSELLKYLGRKHSPDDVSRSLDAARNAGLQQVQVDLIFGVKNLSSKRELSDEILSLERSGATGVSCYLLTIEETTPFANEQTAGDETIVEEYRTIRTVCESLGFIQHETSNYSRYAPIHNRLYWYGLPYLGLGTGAHGLLPASSAAPFGRRYRVGPLSLRRSQGNDHLPFASASESLFALEYSEEERTRDIALQEMLLTLMRTRSGLPLRWLELVYSQQEQQRLWDDIRIRKALGTGLLIKSETHLQLTADEKLRGDSWALLVASLLHP